MASSDNKPCLRCGAAGDAPCESSCEGRVFLGSYRWNNGEYVGTLVYNTPALLPTDSKERKDTPIYSGVLRYFPLALAEIARLSKAGNDKHNPGEPLHWNRGKSNDHADCIARHLVELGTVDPDDGHRHATKLAWRALAALQLELEDAQKTGKLSA